MESSSSEVRARVPAPLRTCSAKAGSPWPRRVTPDGVWSVKAQGSASKRAKSAAMASSEDPPLKDGAGCYNSPRAPALREQATYRVDRILQAARLLATAHRR